MTREENQACEVNSGRQAQQAFLIGCKGITSTCGEAARFLCPPKLNARIQRSAPNCVSYGTG